MRIVIPHCLWEKTSEIAHKGHQGMIETKSLLQSKIWWPGLDRDTGKLIWSCIPCLSNSKDGNLKLLQATIMQNPWEKVHIDL